MAGKAPSISTNPYPIADPSELRIGIIVAQWHGEITSALEAGATEVLAASGLAAATEETLLAWRVDTLAEEAELEGEAAFALARRELLDAVESETFETDGEEGGDEFDVLAVDGDETEDDLSNLGGAPFTLGEDHPAPMRVVGDDEAEEEEELEEVAGGYAVFRVPGAFELPSAAAHLSDTYSLDAVILLGCVIRGGTPHFDFVCQAAAQGAMQAGMELRRPVIFGVLTCDTIEQAWARAGGAEGHKGKEAAEAALQMLGLYLQHW